MSYVDGFVLVVPKKKLAAYKKMATKAGKVWRDHGALDYRECVGDDLKVKMGLPFPKLAKTKAGFHSSQHVVAGAVHDPFEAVELQPAEHLLGEPDHHDLARRLIAREEARGVAPRAA